MFCMKDFPIEASPLSPPVEGGFIDLKVVPTGVGHDRMISSWFSIHLWQETRPFWRVNFPCILFCCGQFFLELRYMHCFHDLISFVLTLPFRFSFGPGGVYCFEGGLLFSGRGFSTRMDSTFSFIIQILHISNEMIKFWRVDGFIDFVYMSDLLYFCRKTIHFGESMDSTCS